MRFSSVIALSSLAIASPIALPVNTTEAELTTQAVQLTGPISNELTLGPCRDVIFIFARGSTEAGNMGVIVGPGVADQLKARLGSTRVAVEGVNYAALLSTNYLPGGTDAVSASAMKTLINLAATKCPSSQILTGGYSQGGAVNHRAIEDLPQSVKDKIRAVVLFGDTQKLADGNQIPGYPTSNTKFYCQGGLDQVCNGVLTAAVLTPHLSYGINAVEAGNWLADHVV
ncbi:cutinase [Xylariaceae sp. FL0594]|nr:cutinase [Xylariaceae sp. FL0594]